MCSLSSSRLENWLRVDLLRCLSLLDKASKGATTINVLILFMYFMNLFVSLFSQTPSRSCQMATHTEPGSGSAGGFFLLMCFATCMLCMRDCYKVPLNLTEMVDN
ncbi:hypothetical protein ILYODFUR_030997 [Ilyodon furcidens]|uniref:Uncharacterized protein n=1 Tax=Ilyodon furcidens TaxID=33524 RepID=A0ABV0V8A1_9TELE